MQNYMLERLLERISVSKYHQNFILKGGFLIAAMVGLDTRATMDMDATIKGWSVNEDSIKRMFLDICKIDLHDDISFEFKKMVKFERAMNTQDNIVKRTFPLPRAPITVSISMIESFGFCSI